MAIPSYPEHSGVELEFYPTDVNGVAATPENCRWRLVCKSTNEVVQDWTVETPGSAVAVFVSGLLTELRNRAASRELWSVVFVANYDLAREFSAEADFYLKRSLRVN